MQEDSRRKDGKYGRGQRANGRTSHYSSSAERRTASGEGTRRRRADRLQKSL